MRLYLTSKHVPELADLPFWTRWRVTDRCSKALLMMPRFWVVLTAVTLWHTTWIVIAASALRLTGLGSWSQMVALWGLAILAVLAGVVVLIHLCYTLLRPRLREYRQTHCGCGYDLRGSAGACPECGRERPAWAHLEPACGRSSLTDTPPDDGRYRSP